MALKTLPAFSPISSPNYHHSSSPSSAPLFSPFIFLFKTRPPSSKPFKPLLLSSQSPIFLPILDQDPKSLSNRQEPVEYKEEEEVDPIRVFFKSRSQTLNPKQEGRVTLQRNRRTSWRIAQTEADPLGKNPSFDDPEAELVDSSEEVEVGSFGIVEEILKVSRNLPENSTLGDFLGSYVGKIGKDECVELLIKLGEEGLVNSCLYFFEWMRMQEPSLVTPRACSVIFPVLGMAGMGEKVMVLFANLPQAKGFRDVRVYNSAISGLGACGRYNDAWKVYEALETNNIIPDHVTCSILITIMRKSGKHAKDAWQFFERMNRKGVKWSLEVFGTLIKSFCDEGLKKEALIIQSEMEKKGISSNAIIYNTLMNAYSKSNQIEEAEGLFDEMKEKGVKPTMATYNILMDAYSRRMQPEIIEDLLLEMQGVGLKPNVKSYTCLISAYARQRKMSDMAADSFLRMKKAGIKPTSHSYTALIHAYSLGGWHEKAFATFESMKREGIKPSIETYTTLLDAFRRAGETHTLMEIWKSMVNDKVEGTRVTFNIVLDGLAKHGLYVQARDVMSEFGRFGFQPTVMTYNMLMNAYARGGQHYKLPQLLKEMAALNLKPDSVTYSTMIYAYVRVRDFTRAFYYHKQMVKSGQVPDAKSYQKLRSILNEKAEMKNRRDRSAILGIVNSKMGIKPKSGKKDEFWKSKKRQSR
ncbi:pentatricopeptide repeat-containing protein At5g50280, chloroplastic isoform X2 [Asparagus officinalis]|nr:pentatricopeptide repeat-containing protein At5g50280, chloroplastic isoform X2 [Asparagus officinalis]